MTADLHARRTALLDQLDGASVQTRDVLTALADDHRGSEPARSTSRATRRILRRFARQAVTGVELCQHLSPTSAAGWWVPGGHPGDDGHISCADCASAVLAARTESACAACGTTSPHPVVELTATAGVLLAEPDGTLRAIPAVIVAAVVCRDDCPPQT